MVGQYDQYPLDIWQGYEHAALAIYRGMTGDKEAVLRVFVQWASPAAWFQRSTVDGQPVQLEKVR